MVHNCGEPFSRGTVLLDRLQLRRETYGEAIVSGVSDKDGFHIGLRQVDPFAGTIQLHLGLSNLLISAVVFDIWTNML